MAFGYQLGLIDFYETADTSPLAECLTENYEKTSPGYQATMASHRVPRQMEIRESERITARIRQIVAVRREGDDIASRLETNLSGLDTEDRDAALQVVQERLDGLNPAQEVIYGVDDATIEAWL